MIDPSGAAAPAISRRSVLAGAAAAPFIPAAAKAQAGASVQFDVVVVGSGAAGAVAALFAHQAGASVAIVEKANHFGGTAAKSGGNIWVPNNFEMRKRGIADPLASFLQMAARYSYPDRFNPDDDAFGLDPAALKLLTAFYNSASATIDAMAAMGALKTRMFHFGPEEAPKVPDYFDDPATNPGSGKGRVLSPVNAAGEIGIGDELMAQLGRAIRARAIPVLLGHRVTGLLGDAATRISGVIASTNDGAVRIGARRGVVFASGGYTHNADLLARFQVHPVFGGCALPTCTGDFISIAETQGAAIGNTGGAWRAQVILDDVAAHVSTPQDVWVIPGDSSLVVNRFGRRTMNEKRNYHARAKSMYAVDPTTSDYPNLIQFMIYDQRTAERWAGVHPLPPTPAGADHVIVAPTLDALAKAIRERIETLKPANRGVQLDASFSANLTEEVARFGWAAKLGVDPRFGRGNAPFDTYYHNAIPTRPGTPFGQNTLPNATMHPLSPPYFAIILAPGTLDTNGGPIIDEHARVIGANGTPIPGLYGAGNCIASAARDAYWAAGATLGNAIAFGSIAGRRAAGDKA